MVSIRRTKPRGQFFTSHFHELDWSIITYYVYRKQLAFPLHLPYSPFLLASHSFPPILEASDFQVGQAFMFSHTVAEEHTVPSLWWKKHWTRAVVEESLNNNSGGRITKQEPIISIHFSITKRTKKKTIRAIAGDCYFESHEPHSRKPKEKTCYFWLTRRYFWSLYVPSLYRSDPSMYPTLIPKQREEKEDLTTTSFIITTS